MIVELFSKLDIRVPFTRLTLLCVTLFCLFGGLANANDPSFHTIKASTARGDFSWSVELAANPSQRQRGLMHRRSMKSAHGMLFRFDQFRVVTMWMKNTFIPLDMIFMNDQGVVTHIHRSAKPLSEQIISSRVPARFVFEVNAGEVLVTGLKLGDKMNHPWFSP